MLIETRSWKKDSFGLFDFECKELQRQTIKHRGTGRITRDQKIVNNDKRNVQLTIKTKLEPLSVDAISVKDQTSLAKIVGEADGYWLFHSNRVDLTEMFAKPEEKLWLVVKDYNINGLRGQRKARCHLPAGAQFKDKNAIKLEKNSVIKMGRVRLRVRDIDYP